MDILNRIRKALKRKKRRGASPRKRKVRNYSSAVLAEAVKAGGFYSRSTTPPTISEAREELLKRSRKTEEE